MRTIVKGKSVDVPEQVRQYAERKMRRLGRLLDDRTDAVIELSSQQHRGSPDSQIASATIVIGGQVLRSRASGPTYQACLDTLVDRIERQAVDAREKHRERRRGADIAHLEPAGEDEPGPNDRAG